MKIYETQSNEKELFLKVTDVLLPDTPKEKILIYDIDTTAFEAANGCVFLIGAEYFESGELKVKQYFSEDIREELDIIEKFLSFAYGYEVLLNYKGNSFDIPFLAGRIDILRSDTNIIENEVSKSQTSQVKHRFITLQENMSHLRKISYDLFDEIRPLKTGLDLASTKIDIFRKLTGQTVTEKISGENISLFYVQHLARTKLKAYTEISNSPENVGFISDYHPNSEIDELAHISVSENPSFLQDVLNRNRDNIQSVLYISRLAHIFNMRKGLYNVSIKTCDNKNGIDNFTNTNHTNNQLITDFDRLNLCIYNGCIASETKSDTSNNKNILLSLPILELSLKQFYINYRDYYYFPAENMAMHKSVAEFADKASRKKATAQTAFSMISGRFVKIPAAYIKAENKKEGCLYKESYESENYYLPVNNIPNMNNDNLKMFAYFCMMENFKYSLSDILI